MAWQQNHTGEARARGSEGFFPNEHAVVLASTYPLLLEVELIT